MSPLYNLVAVVVADIFIHSLSSNSFVATYDFVITLLSDTIFCLSRVVRKLWYAMYVCIRDYALCEHCKWQHLCFRSALASTLWSIHSANKCFTQEGAAAEDAFGTLAHLSTLKALDICRMDFYPGSHVPSILASLLALSHLSWLQIPCVWSSFPIDRYSPATWMPFAWSDALIQSFDGNQNACCGLQTLIVHVNVCWGILQLEALVRSFCKLKALKKLHVLMFNRNCRIIRVESTDDDLQGQGGVQPSKLQRDAHANDTGESRDALVGADVVELVRPIALAAGVTIMFTPPA